MTPKRLKKILVFPFPFFVGGEKGGGIFPFFKIIGVAAKKKKKKVYG